MLLNKFSGAMLGGLVGDCLGATFEMKYENMIPVQKITKFLDEVRARDEDSNEDYFEFTDDTAMARQIAKSFIEQKKMNPKHLAKSFTDEYFREPWRGYGGSVVEVFKKLRDSECEQPFRPAAEQFSGSGSYGNGAGMRAHPLGLLGYTLSPSELISMARDVSRLTHSHHLGVTGGIVQSLAVYHALHGDTPGQILQKIKTVVHDLEKDIEDDGTASLYKHKMDLIEKHVDCSEDDLPEVSFELGNNVSAVDSVPTALFCFLRARREPGLEEGAVFQRVLVTALRMGGDTDTIASMACSLAGASGGEESIPRELVTCCEDHRGVAEMGRRIHDIVIKPASSEHPKKKQKLDNDIKE